MPRSSYDVIILGRELAATVAGALLCQRGLRVLMLALPGDPAAPPPMPGQAQAQSDRYNLGPYVLPTAPMPLVGLEAPGMRRVIGELNLVQLFRRRIEPNRPSFQLLFPDLRVDIDDELLHAIEREAPAALLPFERAAQRTDEISLALESILGEELMLPPDGFWDRRDERRVASRLPDDSEDLCAAALAGVDDPRAAMLLRGLITLPARFHTNLVTPGAVATARAAALWRAGSHRIDGGRDGLRLLFTERLRALGGEQRPDLCAERLVLRRGRVVAVDVGGSEGEIGCEHVIAGTTAAALLPLLGDEKPSKRLAEAAAIKAGLHRYLLHMVVPLDVLPDALGRVAFSVRAPEAPLLDGNALQLQVADGYGQHAVLTIEALTTEVAPASLRELRKKLRRHVAELLPFVDRHTLCVHSPNDGEQPEGVTESAPPPRAMEALWSFTGPLPLGVCATPYDTGIRGLHLGGRQALPGLGVEGEIEAASRLARLVAAGSKKRDATGATVR